MTNPSTPGEDEQEPDPIEVPSPLDPGKAPENMFDGPSLMAWRMEYLRRAVRRLHQRLGPPRHHVDKFEDLSAEGVDPDLADEGKRFVYRQTSGPDGQPGAMTPDPPIPRRDSADPEAATDESPSAEFFTTGSEFGLRLTGLDYVPATCIALIVIIATGGIVALRHFGQPSDTPTGLISLAVAVLGLLGLVWCCLHYLFTPETLRRGQHRPRNRRRHSPADRPPPDPGR